MKIIRSQEVAFIPASHEDRDNPGVLKKILFNKNDFIAGSVQMINWALLPRGSSFASHYHEDMQEIFIMLNGPVIITADGTRKTLWSGDSISIPPRCVHTMQNRAHEDVAYIVVGISMGTGGKTVVTHND